MHTLVYVGELYVYGSDVFKTPSFLFTRTSTKLIRFSISCYQVNWIRDMLSIICKWCHWAEDEDVVAYMSHILGGECLIFEFEVGYNR